ncbi:MAG: integron, partial [Campylobacterota bacterium]|nr:integron [Campylobacterota bacterium]
LDACGAIGAVRGISRNGDGFIAVRSGSGGKYKMIDKLYRNGEYIIMCDSKGKWTGIVYGENCGVGTPISRRQPYKGSCKSGWVYEKYIRLIAG